MNSKIQRMLIAALMLALAFVLPFLTGQIRSIGMMLLPMHIPVLLCGFLCGPLWGALVGMAAPLLRSLLAGAPVLMPTALCMAFELAAYGFFAALFGRLFSGRGLFGTLLALLLSLLCGRMVWGLVSFFVYHFFMNQSFTLALFFASAFATAWPGILLQFVLIPLILTALGKAHLIPQRSNHGSNAK